jgi:4-amino-4-deoxy-L-arabinose transferase-like glycosyltransferase
MRGRIGLRKSWEVVSIVLITLLAAALRFYRLPDLPPGLHFDEGFKGVTARGLLEGAPPRLFFESDMGEEPIAMYLVAATLGLLGQEPWQVRLPSAVVGVLTIPLAWWLGRDVFRLSRSRRTVTPQGEAGQMQVVALGTALVLAILYWHLSFSRIGMEPILVPFIATLAFAALARGLNTGRWPWFVLAGLALGGSLYTYKAGYFVPLVAVLFVVYAAAVERGFVRRHGRRLLLAAVVAVLVAAPIGLYLASHPASFVQRPASVALVGGEHAPDSPLRAVAGNFPRVLGMFFWQGDANPRSNLPGRPALDPFLAVLFLVGLGRALVGFRRPAWALPLIWLGVMALPTLITEHAPHFGRAIGSTPAIALLCSLGGWVLSFEIWNLRFLQSKIRVARPAVAVLLGAGLLVSGISTARAYFDTWGSSPDLFYAYDVGLTQVARYANTLPAGEEVYLTPTACHHFTLQFLLQRPCASFDGRAGLVFPAPGREATVVVLLREDGVTLPALEQLRPDGKVTWTLADDLGRPYAAAYHLPASESPAPAPAHAADVTFGGAARLLGYATDGIVVAQGETLTLTLTWQALAPLAEDYTVFTHLLGANGGVAAGHDSQPDGGHYPTSAWQAGETILDAHELSIPADAPPGDYQLEVGLYNLATLARLPASDGAGQPLPDDAALLGTIEVRKAGHE